MAMSREWQSKAKQEFIAYARRGRSETKEAARVWALVKEAANGRWKEFEQVDSSLARGNSLRFFEAGGLTVIVQVLDPVKIKVVAVGVAPLVFHHLVAEAVNVL
jgi:hypothetical protein